MSIFCLIIKSFLETSAEILCMLCITLNLILNLTRWKDWEKYVKYPVSNDKLLGLILSLFMQFLKCHSGGNLAETWQICLQASYSVPFKLSMKVKTLHWCDYFFQSQCTQIVSMWSFLANLVKVTVKKCFLKIYVNSFINAH